LGELQFERDRGTGLVVIPTTIDSAVEDAPEGGCSESCRRWFRIIAATSCQFGPDVSRHGVIADVALVIPFLAGRR
jgi:hypothetical protein